MKEKNKITYGNIEVDKDFESTPMIRTTMFLDVELKRNLQKEAKERGIKYQQLVREILSNYLKNEASLEDRVSALEKLVMKKQA
ncbi:MAG: hypothetical protein H6622_11420 [Halobacteriovoraceae bacterium]|nr:hypothetical protein [Halobacteriovoraceae bacterium]